MCRLMGHGIPDGLFKVQRRGGDDEQRRLLALLPGKQALGWISHLWGLPDILLEGVTSGEFGPHHRNPLGFAQRRKRKQVVGKNDNNLQM